MGIYKSRKNYGWGKTMRFAAKNALRDLYGHGHFSTVSTHLERWNQFVKFLNEINIKDVSQCEIEHIKNYAKNLKILVENNNMEVAYAHNLLSTVNTVFDALGADKSMKVSPAHYVGKRKTVRKEIPQMNPSVIESSQKSMSESNLQRISCLIDLIRKLGLRSKEASLLDCKLALKEAKNLKSISIIKGTKGGRKRFVPVLRQEQLTILEEASLIQGKEKNLIPSGQSWYEWKNGYLRKGRELLKTNGIPGFHDQRAAYACIRYEEITENLAPVISGNIENRDSDKQAREIIAEELGHNRIDVVSAYIGGRREYI